VTEAAAAIGKRGARDFVIGLIVVAILFPPLLGRLRLPGAVMDEGSLLVYPELILQGKLPYRDFESVYGPGNIYLLAGTYAAFGTNIFVERSAGLVFRILILAAIFGIARHWGTLVAAGSTLVTGVLLICSELTSYSWIYAIAFALCGLWAIARHDSSWRAWIGGLAGGLALLCRIDFAPALFLSALPIFLAMSRERKMWYVLGVVVAISPLAYFAVVIGPAKLADTLFWYPIFRLNPARHLPFAAANPALLRLLWMAIAGAILSIIAGVALSIPHRTRSAGRLLLGAALLGAGGIPYAVQRLDFLHALFAAIVPVAFAAAALSALCALIKMPLQRWLVTSLSMAAVLLCVRAALPGFDRYFARTLPAAYRFTDVQRAPEDRWEAGDPGFGVTRNGRTFFYMNEWDASTTDQILTELQRVSKPGQRLFVGPNDLRRTNYNDTVIYHLMPHLIPASYFLEMNPRSANLAGSRLDRDVATADWLLLNRSWDYWAEHNASAEYGSDAANQVVQTDFDVWAESGGYLLYANEKLRGDLKLPEETE